MVERIMQAIVLAVLPYVVLRAGAWAAARISGRERVTRLLAAAAPDDRTPLNQRRSYDAGAVQRHWGALDADALGREARFLQMDLLLPVLFTAAFAFSFIRMVEWLGPPLQPAFFLVPVAALLLADWTENGTMLRQLGRYAASGGSALQAKPIRIASMATLVKLLLFAGLSLVLAGLAVLAIIRALG
jgi:hypothetical protein